MAFCVGLTGGIGSGKSKAAELFAALGACVVDTDAISHELTAPRGAAIASITHEFGIDYLRTDGSLDRARMRALVFDDPLAKVKLEAILHPLIRSTAIDRVATAHTPYVILVVPLLLETGGYLDSIRRVLVIDCAEDVQVARTMARSNLSEIEVRAIMKTQLSRAERLARADDVIHNNADLTCLRSQVETLHQQYLSAARGAV